MSAPAAPIVAAASPAQAPRLWPLLLLFALLAAVPLAAKFGAESYILGLFTRALIFAIAAMSLDIILGYGALVSFGHAAFLGIGAYAVGILSAHAITDFFVQMAVAVGVAALFAALTSMISLRTSGVYYIMSTLAFCQMLFFLAVSLSAYGGDDGLTLGNRSLIFGQTWLHNDRVFYYTVLALLLVFYGASRRVVASRFGRVFTGIRENPQRIQAIGFSKFPFQLTACIVAGMMCAVAGVLLANQAEFVSPSYMSWQRSGELLIMVVLGGIGSLHGAIIGALAFLLLEEWLSGITEHWKMIFGPLLIIIVLLGRGGILGLLNRIFGARHG